MSNPVAYVAEIDRLRSENERCLSIRDAVVRHEEQIMAQLEDQAAELKRLRELCEAASDFDREHRSGKFVSRATNDRLVLALVDYRAWSHG